MVPIDHGYALPGEIAGEVTLEWLSWPAAKQPFNEDMRAAILAIDIDKTESALKKRISVLRPECLATLRTCTLLLKYGVQAGLTAYDIGMLMTCQEDGGERTSGEEILQSQLQERHMEQQALMLQQQEHVSQQLAAEQAKRSLHVHDTRIGSKLCLSNWCQ